MILNDFRIQHTSRSDRFQIYIFGDFHIGNRACDVNKLKLHIKECAENINAYWLGIGDYIEAINYTDKRFDPTQLDPSYQTYKLSEIASYQIEDLMTILSPIKDKCIGLHRGNHEETLRLKYHFDPLGFFRREWKKVTLLEDSAFTRITFDRLSEQTHGKPCSETFIMWSAHGNIGGRKSGGKINRIEDAMAFFEADMYVMGHGHRKIITSLTQLSTNHRGEQRLEAHRRIGGMTGAYFKTYVEGASTYAEKGMFSPSDLGGIKITIDPSDRNYFISEI